MTSAEQTQYLDNEKGIDAPGRSTDKPRMEFCEDQNGSIIYIRAAHGHSHGARITPTLLSVTKIPLIWKEPLFSTDTSSNYESILENGGSVKQVDDDLIKNYSQTNTARVDYYPVSHQDSENHAVLNSNLERHDVLKIEDRVQCHTCFKNQRPGHTCCTCGSFLPGITAEVKRQAEQRINSRFIMYVPGVHELAWKNIQKMSTLWKLCRSTKTQESKRLHGFRTKFELRNNRGAPRSTQCACMNNDNHNPTCVDRYTSHVIFSCTLHASDYVNHTTWLKCLHARVIPSPCHPW